MLDFVKHSRFLHGQGFLYLCVLVAGFCGACLRYFCEQLPLPALDGFPLNTLLINVIGCYCIFIVFHQVGQHMQVTPKVVKVINSGFLGAFTTLAAFCQENINLLLAGNFGVAAFYILATYAVCFVAVMLAVFTCDYLDARRGGDTL